MNTIIENILAEITRHTDFTAAQKALFVSVLRFIVETLSTSDPRDLTEPITDANLRALGIYPTKHAERETKAARRSAENEGAEADTTPA